MSCIVDGMDQSKLKMPRMSRQSKGISKQLDADMMGVLFHGPLKRIEVFLCPNSYTGGSNVVVHCLNDALKRMQTAYMTAGRPFPQKLHVQLDNTTKENKNQFIMSYFHALVASRVFSEVHLSFLPVGHTHEVFACAEICMYSLGQCASWPCLCGATN